MKPNLNPYAILSDEALRQNIYNLERELKVLFHPENAFQLTEEKVHAKFEYDSLTQLHIKVKNELQRLENSLILHPQFASNLTFQGLLQTLNTKKTNYQKSMDEIAEKFPHVSHAFQNDREMQVYAKARMLLKKLPDLKSELKTRESANNRSM